MADKASGLKCDSPRIELVVAFQAVDALKTKVFKATLDFKFALQSVAAGERI